MQQATKRKESPSHSSAPEHDHRIIVKKYPNRRLYNTASSTYVTLDDLCDLVKQGHDFVVLDAKTNEDLTRQILTQIIFEQESKGYSLLPVTFLRGIIGFYGNTKMQPVIPHYLEMMMENFSMNQDKVRQLMDDTVGGFSPFAPFGEIGKQNMAFFNQAMQIFNPLGYFGGQQQDKPEKKKASGSN